MVKRLYILPTKREKSCHLPLTLTYNTRYFFTHSITCTILFYMTSKYTILLNPAHREISSSPANTDSSEKYNIIVALNVSLLIILRY